MIATALSFALPMLALWLYIAVRLIQKSRRTRRLQRFAVLHQRDAYSAPEWAPRLEKGRAPR